MVTYLCKTCISAARIIYFGMAIYLGLGSNLGDRKQNLNDAITRLAERGVHCVRCSPVIETPALLPDDASWEWNIPFLNAVIEVTTDNTPAQVLATIHSIQSEFKRDNIKRWSPRPIDIDILLWHNEQISTDSLIIPHKDLHLRHFVLTPLIALSPSLTIPGRGNKTLLEWSKELPHHIPLWMGILNATPDSFSDGGVNFSADTLAKNASDMVQHGASILDIGGESTRPGAQHIEPETEWQRIGPFVEQTAGANSKKFIRPLISVDTRHVETAAKSINCGVDFINDVSGLSDPSMIELAADNNCQWITMHNVGVPADPKHIIKGDPVQEVAAWLESKLTLWTKAGIALDNIIFDPGLGFGKDPLQSLKLLQAASQFREYGLRLLIGHSRKSFMKTFISEDINERDLATIGVSMQLCQQGVDIIRVHNIADHMSAYRGWSHVKG